MKIFFYLISLTVLFFSFSVNAKYVEVNLRPPSEFKNLTTKSVFLVISNINYEIITLLYYMAYMTY